MLRIVPLSLALSFTTLSLHAQKASSPAESPTDSVSNGFAIHEVVVTGTQTPRLLKKLPIPTQIISRKDLDRVQPRSAADALQMTLPGVQISMHGGQQQVVIQGMAGDYVLFLVDGEKITSEGNGSVDLNRIDISTIERIEIIRGAASALYGSSAIGGVINFITKQGSRPLEASASADISSEGLSRYAASLGVRYRRLSSTTSAGYTEQAPYSIATLSGGVPAPSLFSRSKTKYLSEKLRFRSTDDRLELAGYLRYSFRDQDFDPITQHHYTTHSLGGRAYYAFNSRHNLRLDYNNELYDRSSWYPAAREATPIFLFRSHTGRLQYNYGAEGETPILANVGLEIYAERLRGDRFPSTKDIRRAELYSLYGQAEWHPWSKLSLVGGLRYDRHSRFGLHLSPRLSALYTLGDLRLRASYAEGFRSPSIKELYMDWDHQNMFYIRGSEDLRPEISHLISFSPEYQTKRLNATVIASYNLITNGIDLVPEDGGKVMRYRNTSKETKVLNLQTSLRYLLPSGFSATLDYAFLKSFGQVKDKAGRTLSYSNLRPHNLTLGLTYEHRVGEATLSANYSLRASSALSTLQLNSSTNDYEPVRFSGFSVSRIALGGSWRGKVRVSLGVDNIFDFVPESVNITGTLSPGRTFFSSLAIGI